MKDPRPKKTRDYPDAEMQPKPLNVCDSTAEQMTFWDLPEMRLAWMEENNVSIVHPKQNLCTPIAEYSRAVAAQLHDTSMHTRTSPIRVVELFAGVGGFRIGLERASNRFMTVWNNQWEPTTKRQDASIVYQNCFGNAGHSNSDIATVPVSQIPYADLLVGGFPCQDYSVATTLKNSGGIEGKKGILWWQIHRILHDSESPPPYLFLENVDRLLKSPASQRGRDFAIILASLSDLGYMVEWRVINAADYGMPQRRKRTYIVAYRDGTSLANEALASKGKEADWILANSVIGKAFAAKPKDGTTLSQFDIRGTLLEITNSFNKDASKTSPFRDAGLMQARHVWTQDVSPLYKGTHLTLGQLVVDEREVPEEFFIDDKALEEWKYLKGPKSEKRKTPEGFEYHYTEGGMAFPDPLDKPSRTIITGEGGASPSRFKHVILTPSGRYRRLIPLELERLNMFPDNHTQNASNGKRAFLMGNALVTGIVERIALVLKEKI
ncbi:MAG: DNA (cytosine-5-)-methyltransferase [Victivallales bacterium]|nr:DNA (cytosine-5-)-methyltransferase [Victivallales bacterium]